MPLRNHKQVMAGVEMLEGRAVKKIGRAYRERVTAPIVEALQRASSFEEFHGAIGAQGLLARMDERVVGEALAETGVQAALIGRAAAIPVKKAGSRQQATGNRK